ncbi:MAG: lipopolysaccharide heptosyltransferase family protein [Candidatus Pelagibacter sp. TMED153]|nr:MAG: lipopolysaccharide heptosyltransferase family protein [Candidatus Pelagibacter sp. TMED153]|tara:strand:+ start:97 stop:1050 length:954 start_codon:yes stop_codon:yes gene_type:complete
MKKILLYNSGGGLGDSIQLFTLILSLQNHFKSSEFFYLGAHENHFQGKLKEFNINVKSLDLGLKYFGFRWWHFLMTKKRFIDKDLEKIDLIIDLQSKLRNTIILNKIPHDHFYSSTYGFKFCTKKAEYSSGEHLKNLSNFLNTNIKIAKFNINNIDEKYKLEAKRLLPDKNYVGFSLTQGNLYREKRWSIDNFIELATKINEKKKVPVFFIEKKESDLISKIKFKLPNALFPEHYSSLSCPALVTALATRLNLAISIDNGVMHMMGLANIPMITLFGPTDSEKFSPKIDTIQILDSKKIYKSKNINSITVHDVYKLI